MKARLALEVFGENTRRQYAGVRKLFYAHGERNTFDRLIGMPPPSCWVAEIKGYGDIYKYDREFLPRKLDYTHANGIGSRGIMAEYILESGRVYEVKQQLSWNQSRRYFCLVSGFGDIVELDEDQVAQYIDELPRGDD